MRRPGWRLLAPVAVGALYPAARWSFLRWGADLQEIDVPLPGDDVVRNPTIVTTRAITIEASPDEVWPWVVEMSEARCGLWPESRFRAIGTDPPQSMVTVIDGSAPGNATWVFVLRALDEHRTRLVVRLRARFGLPPACEWLVGRGLEPIQFLRERRQLLDLERKAPVHHR